MKRFLAFFVFLLFGMTVQAEEIEEPKDLYARSAVLMDADSGRVLFEKNGQEVMPMASTTKIITCILALENGNMKDVVTVSANAASQPKVHLGMREGEQFYLKDLLYSLMLESHNDSAVAIAEHLSGSVKEFAVMMNDKATELGCSHTYFVTPNGLDESDDQGSHSTTATELARIMSYCIMESPAKEDFLKITGTSNYSFTNIEGNRSFGCSNHNSFLTMMEGAISGKTGFTSAAGYCYVGALEREGRTFVVALLACGWPNNKNYKWKDTRKLMEYAVANYEYQDVLDKVELPRIQVRGGVPDSGNLYDMAYTNLEIDIEEQDKLQVLLRRDENVEVKTEFKKNLVAPIKSGEEVGSVTYYLNGMKIQEYPVVTARSVSRKDLSWYLVRLARQYFCL